MHIIAGIIALVSAIAVWQWRIQRTAEVARELEGVARTAANLPRRFAFKRKSGKRGLSLIDDPMEAAAVLMVEMARAEDGLTREAREVIDTLVREEFHLGSEDADALIAYANWILRDAPVADAVFARMSKLVFDRPEIGPKEIVDLDGMLVSVSEAEGLPSPDQLSLLQTFRNTVGLRT